MVIFGGSKRVHFQPYSVRVERAWDSEPPKDNKKARRRFFKNYRRPREKRV